MLRLKNFNTDIFTFYSMSEIRERMYINVYLLYEKNKYKENKYFYGEVYDKEFILRTSYMKRWSVCVCINGKISNLGDKRKVELKIELDMLGKLILLLTPFIFLWIIIKSIVELTQGTMQIMEFYKIATFSTLLSSILFFGVMIYRNISMKKVLKKLEIILLDKDDIP